MGVIYTFMLSDRPEEQAELEPQYLCPCDVINIVDGDTWDVRIDLFFENRTIERVRAMEIDTREIHFVKHDSEEYERGMVHKEFVDDWVEAGREPDEDFPFVLYSHNFNRGKYGRVIGDIYSAKQQEWLTESLVEKYDDVVVLS